MIGLKYIFCLLLFTFQLRVWSQPGGQRAFEFLNLPVTAKSAALGGYHISGYQSDINTYYDNPATLDTNLEQMLGLNYVNFVADINFGMVNYAFRNKKIGALAIGLQYLNYGTILETDIFGNLLGEFTSGEYALILSHGRALNKNIRVGGSFKMAFSNFSNAGLQVDRQTALGFAADIGGHYLSDDGLTSAGIVARNLGLPIVSLSSEFTPMPLLLQAAVSRKISKAPFRLSLMMNNLQTWRLAYDDPNFVVPVNPLTGREEREFSMENLLRKAVFGVEFIPSKSFTLAFGYNHNRRQDLKLSSFGGLTGFSFGVGIKVKKLQFNYSLARYSPAANSSHLGLNFKI